jgi:hypothetical protein
MKKYLTHSANKALKERKEYFLYDIPVSILNPLPEHINIKDILEKIKEIIPYEICSDLEGIYIGEFSELKDRKIQAMFKEGAIYLSSFKDFPDVTDKIIINDIIHELAHMFEDNSYFEIYDDDSIENEYVGKKKKLVALLRANDISFAGMGKLFFSDEFVDELDDFLFNNLGYDNLALLTAGLFMSPYSVTSIREYFANGFEEYINGDQNYLKDISPALYNKLENVLNME